MRILAYVNWPPAIAQEEDKQAAEAEAARAAEEADGLTSFALLFSKL